MNFSNPTTTKNNSFELNETERPTHSPAALQMSLTRLQTLFVLNQYLVVLQESQQILYSLIKPATSTTHYEHCSSQCECIAFAKLFIQSSSKLSEAEFTEMFNFLGQIYYSLQVEKIPTNTMSTLTTTLPGQPLIPRNFEIKYLPPSVVISCILALKEANHRTQALSAIESYFAFADAEKWGLYTQNIQVYEKLVELYVLHLLPPQPTRAAIQSKKSFLEANSMISPHRKQLYLKYLNKLEQCQFNQESLKSINISKDKTDTISNSQTPILPSTSASPSTISTSTTTTSSSSLSSKPTSLSLLSSPSTLVTKVNSNISQKLVSILNYLKKYFSAQTNIASTIAPLTLLILLYIFISKKTQVSISTVGLWLYNEIKQAAKMAFSPSALL